MFIRQIHYLLALAKTRHFGRAAEASHVSQPALSNAIQHLEEELGVTLIRRGQRFEGFTEEGEKVMQWARILAQDWEGMRQAAAQYRRQLTGVLKIGTIPTMLAATPLLTEPCQAAYPGVSVKLTSLCAEELIRQLDRFELDLGLTYLDDPRLKGFRILPLYRERHVLLARNPDPRLMKSRLGWNEVEGLPLCLLTQNMQNRHLIDAAFREAGVIPRVMLETDSIFALYAHVCGAGLYSVVPHSMLNAFEMHREVIALPLAPELSRQVGLVMRRQNPSTPIQDAAWNIAQTLDLQPRFDALITAAY
ncbi:LysR family transcriptional regulator [Candidatus Methylomicrobium oryzae]|jgi:DNA-binding transcriptional LysR family regulator|uniref:LysR family transcriptional regulator n=1 Tax=Candidatus Methylomicrobium oryzae TaxID=2802053 RepID=UPI00192246BD|nr:LysR substrate-binding domain-containing protein [Methylomicrobium sp. RS1]MBL1265684.1 LysR family transcriptional regulator [Methylomicrobium sp. RS1]